MATLTTTLAALVERLPLGSPRSRVASQALLAAVNRLAPLLRKQGVEDLRGVARRLRATAREGVPLESYQVEAFGLVREVLRRETGLFAHDEQVLGGLSLCRGEIAEMATGEGKTLVQCFPAVAFGLAGKGIHLATANPYLAERDWKFAERTLSFLGVSSACLQEGGSPEEKRNAYRADVTYGTGSEFGFDYLRDQLALMQVPPERPGERLIHTLLGSDRPRPPLMQRDRDYLVKGDKVVIVDQFTGRARPDSTWRDGLHQAVEVKEELDPSPESETAATISRQRYFKQYRFLCGMTGTAEEAAAELREVYRLRVSQVPQHRPRRVEVLPARVFCTDSSRFEALAEDVLARHRAGQPVLVGTRSIEVSEQVEAHLKTMGVPVRLLNAKQDAEEADIVSEAGQPGRVTIATNMAGRGTDIRLGEGVEALGGLHVILVGMEESRRIDRQLEGRTGRQGVKGSCQYFLSADDPLLRVQLPDEALRLSGEAEGTSQAPSAMGEVAAARWLTVFQRAQRMAETRSRDLRRRVMLRDRWLIETKQRLAQ